MEDIIAGKGQKWQGYYEQYGVKQPMQFDKFFIENDIIKGMGVDVVGEFDIDGKITNNEVYFDKQYRGKHNVIYKGVQEGRVLVGSWHIRQYNGGFKIWNADVSPWRGVFYENGNAYIMHLQANDLNGLIGGSGEDYLGQFVISGTVNEKNEAQITKEYIGKQKIIYNGRKIRDGQYKGSYTVNDKKGLFILEKCEESDFEKEFNEMKRQKEEEEKANQE